MLLRLYEEYEYNYSILYTHMKLSKIKKQMYNGAFENLFPKIQKYKHNSEGECLNWEGLFLCVSNLQNGQLESL